MANCYRCGRPILTSQYYLRRRVRTGDLERKLYPGARVSAVQTHYGMRVVCTRCAYILDRQQSLKSFLRDFLVVVLLFALIVFLALHHLILR